MTIAKIESNIRRNILFTSAIIGRYNNLNLFFIIARTVRNGACDGIRTDATLTGSVFDLGSASVKIAVIAFPLVYKVDTGSITGNGGGIPGFHGIKRCSQAINPDAVGRIAFVLFLFARCNDQDNEHALQYQICYFHWTPNLNKP